MNYKREDIIRFGNTLEPSKVIGLQCYPADDELEAFRKARADNGVKTLTDISEDSQAWYPFECDGVQHWRYIILKKESRTTSFDWNLKKDRDILKDRWLIHKETGSETRIQCFTKAENGFWTAQLQLNDTWVSVVSAALFEDYLFADTGKPVGKEVEE